MRELDHRSNGAKNGAASLLRRRGSVAHVKGRRLSRRVIASKEADVIYVGFTSPAPFLAALVGGVGDERCGAALRGFPGEPHQEETFEPAGGVCSMDKAAHVRFWEER
jgi:hypothetical protein